jgi:hypothetical protein
MDQFEILYKIDQNQNFLNPKSWSHNQIESSIKQSKYKTKGSFLKL